VRAALDVGAERIGHGIRAAEDNDVMRRLREEQIPLEICITSNVKTGAVRSLHEHPVRRLLDAGVPITLNTDDPGIFETTLEREFAIAKENFGFYETEVFRVQTWADLFRFRR
jgi:adenosine deaminase